jgi:hypothetical protein
MAADLTFGRCPPQGITAGSRGTTTSDDADARLAFDGI